MQSDFNDNRGVYIGDRGSDTIIDDNENVQKHKRTKIKRILPFLNEYSDALIAVCACLTTFFACLTVIATFLIWDVTRKQVDELTDKQVELTDKQVELTDKQAELAEQPIIQTNYNVETLGQFARKHNLGSIAGKGIEIRTIQVSNIGRGSAYNLKIEQRGRETIEEIDTLPVGQTYEYFVMDEKVKSGAISPYVKVTYQDIFENEFTLTPELTTIPEP